MAAIRWGRPRHWPRSTCSRKSERWSSCRPKSPGSASILARLARLPHVGDVRQRGLIAAVELVRDVATKEPYPWQQRRGLRVCDHARREGVWLRPLGNVIVIMPPLAVTLEQLDQIAGAVERGIPLAT